MVSFGHAYEEFVFFLFVFLALLFFGGAPGFGGSQVVKICSSLVTFRRCGSSLAQRLFFKVMTIHLMFTIKTKSFMKLINAVKLVNVYLTLISLAVMS